MPIIRAKHNKDFTQINNATLREKGLSLRARGLLAYMLSFPDNWEFSVCNIVAETGESEYMINKTLSELEKAGFFSRIRVRNSGGKIVCGKYTVSETGQKIFNPENSTHPAENELDKSDKNYVPSVEMPQEELPRLEIPHEVNCRRKNNEYKRISKERILSQKESKRSETFDDIIAAVADESLKSALEEYVQMRFYIKKPPTNAALKHYIARVFAIYPDDADLRLQCVRQSVLNSRPNAFPLPSKNSKPTASPSSARSSAERRARHAESMRDSWQIILSDIEEEREDG